MFRPGDRRTGCRLDQDKRPAKFGGYGMKSQKNLEADKTQQDHKMIFTEPVFRYAVRMPESLAKLIEDYKWKTRKSFNRVIVEALEEKFKASK